MDMPADLKATEKTINREFEARNINAVFTITSYNPSSRGFAYSIYSKFTSDVQKEAQEIVDRALREYRNSQPNFTLFHRR